MLKWLAVFAVIVTAPVYAHANGCAEAKRYVDWYGRTAVESYARRTLGWSEAQIRRFRIRCTSLGYRL